MAADAESILQDIDAVEDENSPNIDNAVGEDLFDRNGMQ
jgi:hypothetical protein